MSFANVFTRFAWPVDQVGRMLLALGLRSAMAELPNYGNVLRRAAGRCRSCGHSEQCRAWLDAHTSAESAPHYCLNLDLFQRLARGRGERSRCNR